MQFSTAAYFAAVVAPMLMPAAMVVGNENDDSLLIAREELLEDLLQARYELALYARAKGDIA